MEAQLSVCRGMEPEVVVGFLNWELEFHGLAAWATVEDEELEENMWGFMGVLG